MDFIQVKKTISLVLAAALLFSEAPAYAGSLKNLKTSGARPSAAARNFRVPLTIRTQNPYHSAVPTETHLTPPAASRTPAHPIVITQTGSESEAIPPLPVDPEQILSVPESADPKRTQAESDVSETDSEASRIESAPGDNPSQTSEKPIGLATTGLDELADALRQSTGQTDEKLNSFFDDARILDAYQNGALDNSLISPVLKSGLETMAQKVLKNKLDGIPFETDFSRGILYNTNVLVSNDLPGMLVKVYRNRLPGLGFLPKRALQGYILAKNHLQEWFAKTSILYDITLLVDGKRRHYHWVVLQEALQVKNIPPPQRQTLDLAAFHQKLQPVKQIRKALKNTLLGVVVGTMSLGFSCAMHHLAGTASLGHAYVAPFTAVSFLLTSVFIQAFLFWAYKYWQIKKLYHHSKSLRSPPLAPKFLKPALKIHIALNLLFTSLLVILLVQNISALGWTAPNVGAAVIAPGLIGEIIHYNTYKMVGSHSFAENFREGLKNLRKLAKGEFRPKPQAVGGIFGQEIKRLNRPHSKTENHNLQEPKKALIQGADFARNVAKEIAEQKIQFHTKIDVKDVKDWNWIVLSMMYFGTPFESYVEHYMKGSSNRDMDVQWCESTSMSKILYEWLLAQPDHSVTPEKFFLKSLEIAEGSVWEALKIGWSVLTVGRLSGGRERNYLKKTQKLADIRGDQHLLPVIHNLNDPNYRWTSKADNFAAWYHFWGTMLYTFLRKKTLTTFPLPAGAVTTLIVLFEEFVVGAIEKIVSWEWKAFLDLPTRIYIDIQGAIAGYRLAIHLKNLRVEKKLLIKNQPPEHPGLKNTEKAVRNTWLGLGVSALSISASYAFHLAFVKTDVAAFTVVSVLMASIFIQAALYWIWKLSQLKQFFDTAKHLRPPPHAPAWLARTLSVLRPLNLIFLLAVSYFVAQSVYAQPANLVNWGAVVVMPGLIGESVHYNLYKIAGKHGFAQTPRDGLRNLLKLLTGRFDLHPRAVGGIFGQEIRRSRQKEANPKPSWSQRFKRIFGVSPLPLFAAILMIFSCYRLITESEHYRFYRLLRHQKITLTLWQMFNLCWFNDFLTIPTLTATTYLGVPTFFNLLDHKHIVPSTPFRLILICNAWLLALFFSMNELLHMFGTGDPLDIVAGYIGALTAIYILRWTEKKPTLKNIPDK